MLNQCWSLLACQCMSNFCPIPALYAKITAFYANIFLFLFWCSGNVCGLVPVDYLWTVSNYSAWVMCEWGGRNGARWWRKLFWRSIYCAKTRPDHKSQSGFRSRKVLVNWYLQIMREYDLENAILIRPLTQPHKCEMGSLSFPTMSWLKFDSMTKPPPLACHPLKGQTEKSFSVAHSSS